MSTPTFNYYIVEDEYLIRQNLIHKIDSLNLPLTLCGQSANGKTAAEDIDRLHPDLVITDIRMPQMDGLELSKYITENHPSIKIIILSGYDDFSYAQTAIHYHVSDYLLKPVNKKALAESLQHVLVSLHAQDQKIGGSLTADKNNMDPDAFLSVIQKYLAEHFREDISLREIADYAGFSQEYVSKLFKKKTGITPTKYLTRLRINESCMLLRKFPKMEIAQVASEVGYHDAFYFSRVFKAQIGQQPSEYRELSGESS
ncbi:MAG: response regulator [Eubacteriales bacterium]|nr:response regulator [Eubacteriales bacterium]